MKIKLSIAVFIGIMIATIFSGCSDDKPVKVVHAITPAPIIAAGVANNMRSSNNPPPNTNMAATVTRSNVKYNELITVRYSSCEQGNQRSIMQELDNMINSGYHPVMLIPLHQHNGIMENFIITWGK